MTTFLVDGQVKKLSLMTDEGIDWSDDFIGDYYHGMSRDDDFRLVVTQEDYDWWKNIFREYELIQERIRKVAELTGIDRWEIIKYLDRANVYDYRFEDQYVKVMAALDDFVKEHENDEDDEEGWMAENDR